jgi:hypothetical protein
MAGTGTVLAAPDATRLWSNRYTPDLNPTGELGDPGMPGSGTEGEEQLAWGLDISMLNLLAEGTWQWSITIATQLNEAATRMFTPVVPPPPPLMDQVISAVEQGYQWVDDGLGDLLGFNSTRGRELDRQRRAMGIPTENDGVGLTALGAIGAGLNDGAVLVGNELTFRLISPLNEAADRLVAENGGVYGWSQVAAATGREVLMVTVGAAALSRAAAGVSTLLAGAPCFVQTTAKVGMAGLQVVGTFSQVYGLGQGTASAYESYLAGDYARMTRSLVEAGFDGVGIAQGLGATAKTLKVLSGGQKAWVKEFLSCFTGETPLIVEDGRSKAIKEIRPEDLVLARADYDAEGALEYKRVEAVFERVGPIWVVRVAGVSIRTTGEHPFWVVSKEWTKASELAVGDWLVSHTGERFAVEAVEDTGEYETVYNIRVADYHTYFVGGEVWGIDVWAHNAYIQDSIALHGAEVTRGVNKGKIRVKDPVTNKIAYRAKSTLHGDHVYPKARIPEAVKKHEKFINRKLTQGEMEDVTKLMNSKQNLRPMPANHNMSKGKRLADEYHDTKIGIEADESYVRGVKWIQGRIRNELNRILSGFLPNPPA